MNIIELSNLKSMKFQNRVNQETQIQIDSMLEYIIECNKTQN
jgi:hypothetical protein